MLGTEQNGNTLAIMLSIFASKAKQEQADAETGKAAQLAMYAFWDAVHRTANALSKVLDAKCLPKDAYEELVDYALRLQNELEELDVEADGL